MLNVLAISNYRSLRNLIVPLQRLNVVTGPNGSGKSSLYRALRLLADTAQGHVVTSLAREGGLQSTLWAGPESISRAVRQGDYPIEGTRRKQPVSLRLGFAGDDFGYLIDMGLPKPDLTSTFDLDPEIKQEAIWHGPTFRPSTILVERHGAIVCVRREHNERNIVADSLAPFDSMMTQIADPRNAPEMLVLRESIRAWRFYDHFRTDAESPARLPQIGTRTPVLGNGSDLAAAIQTIREIGDNEALDSAVSDAFPGGRLEVISNSGRFALAMEQHGMLRALDVAELSDGTLRYLLWIAALLTPRPPALMVLNEPETSLHPDLLAPLARLISRASERSQVIVVTHAAKLIAALSELQGYHSIVLEKEFGETRISGMNQMNTPTWHWPAR